MLNTKKHSFINRINTDKEEFQTLVTQLMDIIHESYPLGDFKIGWLIDGECLLINSQYKLNNPVFGFTSEDEDFENQFNEIYSHLLKNDYIYFGKKSEFVH
jgi:hypothetical protein